MFSLNGSHCSSSFSFFFSRVPITPASAFYFTSISNQRDSSFFFLLLFCKMRESFLCVNLNPWIVPRHFFFFFLSPNEFLSSSILLRMLLLLLLLGKQKSIPYTHTIRTYCERMWNWKWIWNDSGEVGSWRVWVKIGGWEFQDRTAQTG